MTVDTDQTTTETTRYRMELRQPQFDLDFGGRLPAGAVIRVDRETAARWYSKGIAQPARKGAPTWEEIKRAEREAAFELAEEARILREAKEAEALARAAEEGAVLPTATLQRLGMARGIGSVASALAQAAEQDGDEDDEPDLGGVAEMLPANPQRRRGRPPGVRPNPATMTAGLEVEGE